MLYYSCEARILINGNDYGTTPNTIKFTYWRLYCNLEKNRLRNLTKTVAITENTTKEVNETLPSGMEVTIFSEPKGHY